ncbi:hypothetical protein J3459_011499 [Metarhizium acridum]|nr:hypothetical protein J3459_011499 [Metarhizium acridum]
MSRPPVTHKWDENSHLGLLRAMIEVARPNKDFLVKVAKHMQSQGFSTTFGGVNQHIQKLRRTQDSPEKTAKTGSVPVTPTKATPKRKTRAPKTKPAEFDDADDEITVKEEQYYDDDQGEPETKRVKKDAE